MHRLNAKIITADNHPDWMRVTRAGDLVVAFAEANAWLNHGALCVVWAPHAGMVSSKREKEHVVSNYRAEEKRRVWYPKNTSFGRPFDKPHVDLEEIVSYRRRVIHTIKGEGTLLFGFVDQESDINSVGGVQNQAWLNRRIPFMVPTGGAVFFNWYGLLTKRLVHCAPGFNEDSDYVRLPPDEPVREITIWDYDASCTL